MPRIRWVESVALAAYVVVVLVGVVAHEPWWDEAQAWLLARDAGLGELLTTRLAYEGHPPLWYLVLMPFAKLGAPYKTMGFLSAAIGAVGVAILLLKMRAPVYIRVLLAFTFFLAYQFTVVSRSYVLLFPLLLLVALTYGQRGERFVRFCVLLVLMSQVSLHGAALAAALLVLCLVDRVRVPRRQLLTGLSLFAVNVVVLALMLRPQVWASRGPDLKPVTDVMRMADIAMRTTNRTLFGMAVVSIIMLVILLVWLGFTRTLIAYVVMTASLLPISAIYMASWHEGLFFFVLVFAILLAYERGREAPRVVAIAAQVVIVIFLARQARWTFASLSYDAANDFTGSRAAAEFIRERGLDKKRLYGAGLKALEIQPYFPRNIFRNYPSDKAFWDWSPSNPWPYYLGGERKNGDPKAWIARLLAEKPDYIVSAVGYTLDSNMAYALAADPEYRAIAFFEGGIVWKDRPWWEDSFVIYERGTIQTFSNGVRSTTPR